MVQISVLLSHLSDNAVCVGSQCSVRETSFPLLKFIHSNSKLKFERSDNKQRTVCRWSRLLSQSMATVLDLALRTCAIIIAHKKDAIYTS